MTHARKKRSAFEGYNRGLQWERTCAEVAKLKITRRPVGRGEVITRWVSASNPSERSSSGTSDATTPPKLSVRRSKVRELDAGEERCDRRGQHNVKLAHVQLQRRAAVVGASRVVNA